MINNLSQEIKALVLDTETTGISTDAQPIAIAYLELQDLEKYPKSVLLYYLTSSTAKPDIRINKFSSLWRPDIPIHPQATLVHGFTLDMLKDCPLYSEFKFPEVEYLIAHNADFDHRILGKPDVKLICTVKLAKKVFPSIKTDPTGVPNYKLTTLIEHLVPNGRDILDEAHSALGDAIMTLIILSLILEKLPRISTWEELYKLQGDSVTKPDKIKEAKRITSMPYGQYIGLPFEEIPVDYLEWILKNHALKPPLQDAITEAIEKGNCAAARPKYINR